MPYEPNYFGVALGDAIAAGAGHISNALQRRYEIQRQDALKAEEDAKALEQQKYDRNRQGLSDVVSMGDKGIAYNPNDPNSIASAHQQLAPIIAQKQAEIKKKTAFYSNPSPQGLNIQTDPTSKLKYIPPTEFGDKPQIIPNSTMEIGAKESQHQDKLEKQLTDNITKAYMSQRSPLGMQENKVNQATHLRGMLDQYYDPKTKTYSVPSSQYEELAIGLASLISGSGAPSDSVINGIRQKTAKGDINGAIGYVLGTTPSASTDDVFKNLSHAIDRQGIISENLRDNYIDQLISRAPSGLAKDRLKAIKETSVGTKYSDYLKQSPSSDLGNTSKPNEVEGKWNGKIAIFDSGTKKFLRFK